MPAYQELSEEQVEQFVSTGIVVVKRALPADVCKRFVANAFEFHGFDADDASTWTVPYARNQQTEQIAAKVRAATPSPPTSPPAAHRQTPQRAPGGQELAPRAWAAMEDLLGGPDRVEQEPGAGGGAVWSNQLAGNFGSAEDRAGGVEGWEPPDARDANGVPTGGW